MENGSFDSVGYYWQPQAMANKDQRSWVAEGSETPTFVTYVPKNSYQLSGLAFQLLISTEDIESISQPRHLMMSVELYEEEQYEYELTIQPEDWSRPFTFITDISSFPPSRKITRGDQIVVKFSTLDIFMKVMSVELFLPLVSNDYLLAAQFDEKVFVNPQLVLPENEFPVFIPFTKIDLTLIPVEVTTNPPVPIPPPPSNDSSSSSSSKKRRIGN